MAKNCPTCHTSMNGRLAYCCVECRPMCGVENCGEKATCRENSLCRRHHCMVGSTEKVCRTCGVGIAGNRTYCSEDCRPRCAVKPCPQPTTGASTYCQTHRKRGVKTCPTCECAIGGRQTYCSVECRPQCVFATCKRKTHGRQVHCVAHWEQMKRTGEVTELAWAQDWVCIVCGADVQKGTRRRRHCSSRCQMLSSLNPNRPKSYNCVRCGVEVSLIVPMTKAGQFKRSDSKLCKRCKWKTRTGVTVGEIAKRDGNICKICGDAVDLNADPKDPFRGSVDHILPRALGGSHDPSNLQLTHLWCNQVKSSRADFTFLTEEVKKVG